MDKKYESTLLIKNNLLRKNTVDLRNSELQFSGKPRNSGQFSNDQLFIK